MLSELGSTEVCKSIPELGPSLPTNGAEVKGKEFWQRESPSSELLKLLSRCRFTPPDNQFLSPYTMQQVGKTEAFEQVKNDIFGLQT